MNRVQFTAQSLFVVTAASAMLVAAVGCANSGDPPPRDTGVRADGALDGSATDAPTPMDTPGSTDDSGPDSGPAPTLSTCELCTSGSQCLSGFCARLVTGDSACLPGCDADLPDCPRNEVGEFSCILDATGTGISATICAPIGGPCCVDEDGDGYGTGVGCDGTDCNDTDAEVHPDRTEICDGLDTNCNGVVDEPPTDCESGYCNATAAGGTYEQTTSATCVSASCGSGTTTSCGLYTCADGAGDGLTCATTCAGAGGADDDTFCITTAHCEAGTCVMDVPDGGTCNEDSDCNTAHCDSDICCSAGDCCATAADCPGGGGTTRLCDDPTNCQGHRGDATCGTDFRCMVTSGIDDDTACDAGVTARDCGLFDPIMCNGTATQTTRACPTSCLSDTDCIEAAHCSVGFCVPDLPPAAPCARSAACQAGLFCADNVCCTSSCTGSCEACNLAATPGACTAVPPGGDPSGECAGFSCSGYYSLSGDVCSRRSDVADSVATCDGAGMCRSPDVLCPLQAPGAIQVDCNNTCQALRSGSCSGTSAGICDNLDNPGITTSCGVGTCMRTVQACVGGAPNTCVSGSPSAEVCDGLDNDCVSGIDNGTPFGLCPATAQVTGVLCGAGVCSITSCSGNYADVDLQYSTGCECNVGPNVSCAAAAAGGSFATGTSSSIPGAVPRGGERWYTFSFPQPARPGAGTPRISVSPVADFVLQITRTCGAADPISCSVEGGASTETNAWEFVDNASPAGSPGPVGGGAYSTNTEGWPDIVYVRVRRRSDPTNCAEASFTLTVAR